MTNFKSDEAFVIREFVGTFEDLMNVLATVTEVRFEAPPRTAAAKGVGPDPTGDTVTDDKREALEQTIRTTVATLAVATRHMRAAEGALTEALRPYCD